MDHVRDGVLLRVPWQVAELGSASVYGGFLKNFFSFLAVLLALFALGNLAHYFLRADVFCSLDSCVWVLLVEYRVLDSLGDDSRAMPGLTVDTCSATVDSNLIVAETPAGWMAFETAQRRESDCR